MARHRKKGTGLTVRLEPKTRAKLDALAAKRGLTTGALLRSLGLREVEHEEGAAKLLRELERLEPDDGDDAR